MRTDRSAVSEPLTKGTVRRVVRYAAPHRALIALFLAFTVVDAGLVIVTPLLV
jgi:ATP-binding cassette subfamily B protein